MFQTEFKLKEKETIRKYLFHSLQEVKEKNEIFPQENQTSIHKEQIFSIYTKKTRMQAKGYG
jgi:hypothetical protein